MERQKTEAPQLTDPLYSFLEKHLKDIEDKYPGSLHDTALIEEYVPGTRKIAVDSYISQGDIVSFGICDNNYWEDSPETFNSCTYPTRVSPEVQKRALALFNEVAKRLHQNGFNNEILDVEMFVREDDKVQLVEVNGRMFSQMNAIYRGRVENGDLYDLAIKLGSNESPLPRKYNGRFGGNFYVSTFDSGNIEDLLDYEFLDSLPDWVTKQYPDIFLHIDRKYRRGDSVPKTGSKGSTLAMINLVGPNPEIVEDLAKEIRQRLLKRHSSSVWN
ncbi:MAG: hypothetical protein ACI9S8_003009 [Chlamydiales bacterium]|jgi:hypothetical protein